MTEPREAPSEWPRLAVLVSLAVIAALAAAALLIEPLRDAVSAALRGDSAAVREEIGDLGVAGPLIIFALCLVHSVIFYPAEIVDAAAGFAYGFGPGLALVSVGWLANGWISYALGRSLARPLLYRWAGERRFRRAEAAIERGGVPLLLAVRLVPIFPFSVTSYACGAARVPGFTFTWTTIVGYMPITVLSTYFGSRLEELHPTDPLVLGTLAAFAAMILIGSVVARRVAR